jgi:lipopolysaccharide export system permease protein
MGQVPPLTECRTKECLESSMRLLDRLILWQFIQAYLCTLVAFLSLYVVVDLFTRIDEFTESSRRAKNLIGSVAVYYGYRLPHIFERFSGIFTLMSATFTWCWLQQQNEVVPWLAAGVPTRRLLYPLLAGAGLMTLLGLFSREWLLPQCSDVLQRTAEDPLGKRGLQVQGGYDRNLVAIHGRVAFPERLMIQDAEVTFPSEQGGGLVHLAFDEIFYRPACGEDSSGWYLISSKPVWPPTQILNLDQLNPNTFFLHTDLDYAKVTRKPNWFYYESTARLLDEARSDENLPRRSELIVVLHERFTAPLLDILLVIAGLSISANRSEWNIYMKIGLGIIIYVVFRSTLVLCHRLAELNHLDPILAAWIPVFVYGPATVVLTDSIQT